MIEGSGNQLTPSICGCNRMAVTASFGITAETNRIYDGVEAEIRKSQASFQNI